MEFDDLLAQVTDLLQRQGRVSYGALKRRYHLNDDYVEDLKVELIDAQRIATDEDGRILVWRGEERVGKTESEKAKRGKGETGKDRQTSGTLDARLRNAPLNVGERRQLTVMFCDLVGSTALSAQLDPEEHRSFVQQYQEVCAQVVESYDGYVAQYLGDGVLVYFGYPQAHEDDARRAVLAGLEILTTLRDRSWRREGVPAAPQLVPHVRIGVHTGLAVIGEIGVRSRLEQLALGEAPNVAARLQGKAEPDTLVISASTYQLIASYFECRSLGLQSFKGIPHPIVLYQVVGKSSARHRFEVIAPTHFTPLIGRDEELEFLDKCWEQAQEGNGQVVLLSGEPGIGKSRLVHRLKEHLTQTASLRLEAWCSPYHQNSAMYPMVEFLHRSLQLQRDESPEFQLAKLERALTNTGADLPSTVPFLGALLGLSSPRFPSPDLTPQKQREKLQYAMLTLLLKSAERQPILSVWEDVQWADPSTLEWLGLLIEHTAMARLLVVLTFRPEFVPPWLGRSHVRPLSLSRLSHGDSEIMIEKLAAGKQLPREVIEQVVKKTDGIPLFVEELARMVLESGMLREMDERYELVGPVPPLAIPTTLHDSLLARLDRLGAAREVAQIGATLGREFSYEVLCAVTPGEETKLQEDLATLREAEILYQRGMGRQAHYIFRHALIQDAAYQSLLKSRRQQYHQRIACALEEQFLETKEMQPELLAHHYTEAGLVTQALPYWQHAGQRALQRSANNEAIGHLSKALELLSTLPETDERITLELLLRTMLGGPLMAARGYAAPEVKRSYARARELCQQLGETPQLFPVLGGLFAFYFVHGDLQGARTLAQQCLRLAQTVNDATFLLESHRMMGCVLHSCGEFLTAREHLEAVASHYNPAQHSALAFMSGQDPAVASRCFVAWALWLLGYPDQARQHSEDALVIAQDLSHAQTLAFAYNLAASVRGLCCEWERSHAYADTVVGFAKEQGLRFWEAIGTYTRGLACVGLGRVAEGMGQVRQGIAAYQGTGAELAQPGNLGMLADLCGVMGHVEEGQRHLTGALSLMHKNGELMWAGTLYRVQGELALKAGGSAAEAEAEASFHEALVVARRQEAKSLELRATMSLARLWQRQGRKRDASTILAGVYNWFTEGFDTYDLRTAKGLLEELA